MTHRCKRWLVQLCLSAGIIGSWPLPAHAEDTLIWLLRDLPPLTIFEGPGKGQGALDQLLPMLIEHLPEYRHQVLHVNRVRGTQMLRDLRSPVIRHCCGQRNGRNTLCFPTRLLSS